MGVVWQELRYALRGLKKTPAFTAVAVLTLTLGIGANTAMFSVVNSVLLQPLPYAHPENLVQIWNTYTYLPQFPQVELSPGDFVDFKTRAKSFSDMAAYVNNPQGFNLTGFNEPQRLEARFATSGFFPLLGVQLVAGRFFTPQEDHRGATPTLLISHRLWRERFDSSAAAVGRTIMLDGRGYIVAGVLPAGFRLAPSTDVWLPAGLFGDELTSHVHHDFSVIARLKPGVTLSQAQTEVAALNHQELIDFPDTHKNWGVLVKPMEDASAAKMRTALLVVFGAVGLVLLIACANLVNLLLARNATRRKEMALRVALGAGRLRIISQLLVESLVLSAIGGVAGIWLALAGLDVVRRFIPAEMTLLSETQLNVAVLLFTLGVCAFVGVLCGLAPAMQLVNRNLQDVLREGGRAPNALGSHRLRSFLVISEVALALIPLIGAGLLMRSFYRVLQVDPGFHHEHILSMQVPEAQLPYEELLKLSPEQGVELARKQSVRFNEIALRIAALPGVQAAGGITVLPLGKDIRSASRFVIEGQPISDSGARPIAETRAVNAGYFDVMGIPLRAGRMFDEHDAGTQNILISEAMAKKFWPAGDALGKRINLCSLDPTPCWSPIVGIVGNVHQYGLDASPTSDVYFAGGWTPYLVIRTASDPGGLASAVIEEVHKSDPNLPVTDVRTIDDLLAESVSPRRFSMSLLGMFAALALALAAVGIYGVMSYIVSLRTNEIGIRVALGAQRKDIWRLIVGRGVALTFGGIAVGICGALALTKVLSSLLFGITATDPLTFAGVASLLAAVALLACYVPAQRALRVDPIVALRHE